MVFGKLVSNDEKREEVNEIFREIFINELKCNEEDIFELNENQVFHALLYEGFKEENAVAAGRLEIKNDNAYIKLVAVKKEYRKKQYGDMIIRMLVEKARNMSVKNIFTEVPLHLTEMFRKIGFIPYDEEKNKNLNNESIIMIFNNLQLNCCKYIKL